MVSSTPASSAARGRRSRRSRRRAAAIAVLVHDPSLLPPAGGRSVGADAVVPLRPRRPSGPGRLGGAVDLAPRHAPALFDRGVQGLRWPSTASGQAGGAVAGIGRLLVQQERHFTEVVGGGRPVLTDRGPEAMRNRGSRTYGLPPMRHITPPTADRDTRTAGPSARRRRVRRRPAGDQPPPDRSHVCLSTQAFGKPVVPDVYWVGEVVGSRRGGRAAAAPPGQQFGQPWTAPGGRPPRPDRRTRAPVSTSTTPRVAQHVRQVGVAGEVHRRSPRPPSAPRTRPTASRSRWAASPATRSPGPTPAAASRAASGPSRRPPRRSSARRQGTGGGTPDRRTSGRPIAQDPRPRSTAGSTAERSTGPPSTHLPIVQEGQRSGPGVRSSIRSGRFGSSPSG